MNVEQTFQAGLGEHQAGRLREAYRLYQLVISAQPDHVGAWASLGNIFQTVGQPDEAIEAYRKAIELRSDLHLLHNNLGVALRSAGQIEAAVLAGRTAIQLNPNCSESHCNLGLALNDLGQFDAAIEQFNLASQINPNFANAQNGLGVALAGLGKDPLPAFKHAVRLDPKNPEAHYNLGKSLYALQLLDKAQQELNSAIALRPNYIEAHLTLASILRDTGQLNHAIAHYDSVLAISPNHAGANSNRLYSLYFHPRFGPQEILDEHRKWGQRFTSVEARHNNDRSPERRLRIGYVSPNFNDHCQSFFMLPLLSSHDRNRFEIFCYSDVAKADSITQRLKNDADHWRDTTKQNDRELANQIRSDQIDILVDLTMHMAGSRLGAFALKPAPIQVSWLAYPGTTGLTAMDYRLTDPILDPPGIGDEFYVEKSIRLQDAWWCYDPLDDTPINSLPVSSNGYITFGCLNNFCKIHDELLATWEKILAATPGSRLVLLTYPGQHRHLTQQHFERNGVTSDRIIFESPRPRSDYLQLYHQIDITLDTFPCNGHTTTLDALWMGVPVITQTGHTAISRGAASILNQVKLNALIAQATPKYIDIATSLACDIDQLTKFRRSLRERMKQSPLMDAKRFAKNMEGVFQQMWIDWCHQ